MHTTASVCSALLFLTAMMVFRGAAGQTAESRRTDMTNSGAAPLSSNSSLQLAAIQEADKAQHEKQQRPRVLLIRRSLAADGTEAASGTDAPSIPVYGNWCGPNYGSGTPVDAIDSCCRGHDMCYDSTAVYNHCSCDQDLVQCLQKVEVKSHHLRKRAMKAAIVTYFDNTACRCSMKTEMCMPVKKCFCLTGQQLG